MPLALKPQFFLAITVLFGLPCIKESRQSSVLGATWEERFQKEAPQAWDKYRARAKRLQGSFSLTTLSLPARDVQTRIRMEIKQCDGCAMFLQQDPPEDAEKDGSGDLSTINPRYAFALRRRPPAKDWAISMITANFSTARFAAPRPPNEMVEIWSTIPTHLSTVNGSSRVISTEPGFVLKRVTSEVREGMELARVEFEHPSQGGYRDPSIKGSVFYDPNRYWINIAYDLQIMHEEVPGFKGTKTAMYEYQETGDGFPIPRRIIVRGNFSRPGKSSNLETIYELDFRETDVPESAFTLPAFGFPEPQGVSPPRTSRWYLWFIAFGGVSLALGGFFWRRARLRAALS